MSLVPILGYAVIWSDAFQDFVMRFDALGGSLLFTPTQRIYLLYVGSVFVGVGVLLLFTAPVPVRAFADRRAYTQHMMDDATLREMEHIHDTLRPLVSSGPKSDAEEHPDGPFLGAFSRRALMEALHAIEGAGHRINIQTNRVPKEAVRLAYSAWYVFLDRSRPIASFACFAFLIVGGAIFALPSLEVLLMAAGRIGAVLFGFSSPEMQ